MVGVVYNRGEDVDIMRVAYRLAVDSYNLGLKGSGHKLGDYVGYLRDLRDKMDLLTFQNLHCPFNKTGYIMLRSTLLNLNGFESLNDLVEASLSEKQLVNV